MRRPRSPGFGLSVPFRRGAGRLPRGTFRRALGGLRPGRIRRRAERSSPAEWLAFALLLLLGAVFAALFLTLLAHWLGISVARPLGIAVFSLPLAVPVLRWFAGRLRRMRRSLGDDG